MPEALKEEYIYRRYPCLGSMWFSEILEGVLRKGLCGFANYTGLQKEKLRDSIIYCSQEYCCGNVVKYCPECKNNPGEGKKNDFPTLAKKCLEAIS